MASILLVNKASLKYPGGAETRLRAVATRWAKSGHRVYLLCAKTAPAEPREEVFEGVTIRTIRVLPDFILPRFPVPHYLPQALFYLFSPFFVIFYCRRWRINAIRDSMSPFPGLGLIAPLFGPKSIVVLHVLFGGYLGWRRFYPPVYAFVGALGESLLLRGALRYRAVITDAPWVAQYIRERGKLGVSIKAIENGVDVSRFKQRRALNRIHRIVNAARFVEHKGQLDLIDACGQLKARGIDFQLDLYGNGRLRSALEARVASYQLEGIVRILPPMSQREVQERLSSYDLYVMVSQIEGLPVILLEAMAARLPVVVAARPYATTLFEKTLVRFYEPSQPGALAEAISWAIENPF